MLETMSRLRDQLSRNRARLTTVTTENEALHVDNNDLQTRLRNLEQRIERNERFRGENYFLLSRLRSLERREGRRERGRTLAADMDRDRSASPQDRPPVLRSRAVRRTPPQTRSSVQALAQSAEIMVLDDSAMEE